MNLVQRFYAALAHGDTPGVLTLLHDNVHWTEAERFPYYSGTWVGPQAVHYNLLKRLAEDWEVFDAKADDFIVEGARVVSFGSYSGVYKKTGKSLLAPFAHLWAVQDEKIVSFRMYTDTAKVLDAMQ
ncbi:hypothetical protein AWC23_09545 [Mycobacterium saskatchewanense]|uniref:SnoaL-like domain-containing protein n=1 Tax=Mycobacterium saskatchewanense TaxID=220927 RepID=A0AAJ3NSH3_9MYCO|nr:hypothetical protein AWC23_09545 [Mycobacterium saskatchewanense]